MKSSLRSISRVLVFAFATTLVPAHVLAMEAVPVVPSQSDDRVLNVIKRLAPQHLGPGYFGNGCPGILRLINQYESDAQVIEAFQPLIQKHSKVGPMVQDELAKIQNMHGEDLDNQVANFLGYLYLGTCAVANLEADIEQCLEAGLQKAQAAQMDAQERAAQEAAREREALAAQAAQQAAQEEAALEAQIAQVQAELEQAQAQEAAENARRADVERNRQAAIAAQAQAILAKANQDRANFEAQERAYQEQQKIRAEARQRSEEDTRVAAANEEAEQPVAQEDPIVQEPEAVAAPDLSQARPAVEEVFVAPAPAPAVQDPVPAPAAPVNNAAARLAELRAQQAAAHARAQETERARQEAEQVRVQAEQAAQAPRIVRPAVPVNQAAAAQPNAQAGWFDGGLSGVFNNLWERIKANPKTSAAIGIGVAALLYNVISSFMGDDEDEEDDSIAQDEEVVDAPAPERAPVRQAKPAKTTTTLSPEEAEQSRLQGLKRKRAQMRREFFKNRGSRCKSRCKKRCR